MMLIAGFKDAPSGTEFLLKISTENYLKGNFKFN